MAKSGPGDLGTETVEDNRYEQLLPLPSMSDPSDNEDPVRVTYACHGVARASAKLPVDAVLRACKTFTTVRRATGRFDTWRSICFDKASRHELFTLVLLL